MYTLTKLRVKEGLTSRVRTDHSQSGNRLTMFSLDNDVIFAEPEFKDIKEGYQIIVSTLATWLRTSAIANILSCTENKIVFETQTSIYELTKD